MTTKAKRRTWDGGHIHRQKDGRDLYVIERRVGKHRFHISTRAHNETAAHKHLARFEADPWVYAEEMKHGREPIEAVRLTAELILEYREWMLTRPRPASLRHANDMTHRLEEWIEGLRGQDLRRLDLATLKDVVNSWPVNRQHRIIAIKGFFKWLRTEKHLVKRAEDATLDLAVPQGAPEKHTRRKAIELKRVRAALRFLRGHHRNMLLVAAATGWHLSEIQRFARRPDSEIVRVKKGKTIAVLVTWHKTKKWTRTGISSPEVLRAAEQLKAYGAIPRYPNRALKAACEKAGVEPFTFGVMRHSVASWMAEAGASREQVADFLDHADKRTTERFYIDAAVPKAPARLPQLRMVRGGKR